jgi:hypothetical protein
MINKLNQPNALQNAGNNISSATIDSVKIPLFNQAPSLKDKIQALVNQIVAWWNSKLDTKAFLSSLGKSLTTNYNKIANLENCKALTFTVTVPKTNERFDRLFVTMTITRVDNSYQLQHEGNKFGEAFTLTEVQNFKTAIAAFSKSEVKAVKSIVKDVRVLDIKRKVALLGDSTEFQNEAEYLIAAYAKQKFSDNEYSQKTLVVGLKSLVDLGYVFYNQAPILSSNGQEKYAPNKIKFHKSNVVFADGKITLTNQIQLNQLCNILMGKTTEERKKLLNVIMKIVSDATSRYISEQILPDVNDIIQELDKKPYTNKNIKTKMTYTLKNQNQTI